MYVQYYVQGQIGRHKCATHRTYGGLFLPIFPVSLAKFAEIQKLHNFYRQHQILNNKCI